MAQWLPPTAIGSVVAFTKTVLTENGFSDHQQRIARV